MSILIDGFDEDFEPKGVERPLHRSMLRCDGERHHWTARWEEETEIAEGEGEVSSIWFDRAEPRYHMGRVRYLGYDALFTCSACKRIWKNELAAIMKEAYPAAAVEAFLRTDSIFTGALKGKGKTTKVAAPPSESPAPTFPVGQTPGRYRFDDLLLQPGHELVAVVFLTRAGDHKTGTYHVLVRNVVNPDDPHAAANIVRDVLNAATEMIEPITDEDKKKGA